ncbi:GNAT family N-acetyltransferase [Amorphus sp. 3PC139-8]|uniref:GNAT family N-acetyltransferase n=1 Tax=Amorphus sp. 3PC139-8 TaxID=2735676 RepID=UPI00345CA79B
MIEGQGVLTIEILTDAANLAALQPEWRELATTVHPRTPFALPEWHLTWWRHFQRDSAMIRDTLRVYVLRDDEGRLVAVAPMMMTHRPAVGPLCTRELQFFGADPYMTELRGPICRAEDCARVVDALAAQFACEAGAWDWVQWHGVRLEAERDADALAARLGITEPVPLIDYVLKLPASWDALRAQLPRNIKESLRKCYNSLARNGHEFTFRAVAAPEDIGPALERFFALHRMRADKTDTIDHLNVFEPEITRRFLLDLGAQLAETGEILVFQLVIADEVVATRVGFVLGDELYLYFSGYDVAWGRYSVMTTVLAEAIKWAIDTGFAVVNLSTGTDVSKTRWRPDEITYLGGFQRAPALRSRIAYAIANDLRRRVRDLRK